jgi:hypothetical protein
MIELEGCGPDDPDGQGAASVLAAYFDAEHMRAFRQLLWRRLAIGALVAWLVATLTTLLPTSDLIVALLACAAAATAAAVAEWRAKATLRMLIDSKQVPGNVRPAR